MGVETATRPSPATEAFHDQARRIVETRLAWDNHICMPLRPHDESFLPQIERVRAAGVNVVSLNAGFGPQGMEDHLAMLEGFRRWFAARDDRYLLANTVADIDRAVREGKLAVVFDVEGMGPLNDGDLSLVGQFHALGVRWMLVAYNRNNAAGGGCYEDDPGLSDHGRAVLAEMKRVGMVACCSHTGHRTALDVMAHAGNPVIFSHSNASALYPHRRNIPDELIRACAATGGVVGINGVDIFLGERPGSVEAVVEHIDHVAQLVGADHAGVSLDYAFDQQEIADLLAKMRKTFPDDASYAGPIRFLGPEAFTGVVAGLLARGYPEADIAKVIGGNWRRVAMEVWAGG